MVKVAVPAESAFTFIDNEVTAPFKHTVWTVEDGCIQNRGCASSRLLRLPSEGSDEVLTLVLSAMVPGFIGLIKKNARPVNIGLA